jgi:hypothetical protein
MKTINSTSGEDRDDKADTGFRDGRRGLSRGGTGGGIVASGS